MTQRDYRTRVNSPSGTIADSDTFTYDDNGRMLTAVKVSTNNVVTFTYDTGGLLTAEQLTAKGKTFAVGYQYDAARNLDQITYPDGTIQARVSNARNQLSSIIEDSTTLVSFIYDDAGREKSRTLGNGLVRTSDYFNNNLIRELHTKDSATNVISLTYTYDENHNKTSETYAGLLVNASWNTPATIGYDALDRLTEWDRNDSSRSQSWTLDNVGNWDSYTENSTTQTRTHGNAHELIAIDSTSLNHDAKGNMITNANGQTYTWDFNNLLVSATVPSGSPGTTGTHTYEYDALGRRVAKTVGPTTTLYVNKTTPIAYSPYAGQILCEYSSSDSYTTPKQRYTYASYIDEPISKDDGTNTYYYHRNQQYSIVAMTDSSGSVVEQYSFNPYGKTTIYNGSGVTQSATQYENGYTYTARQHDSETNLVYFRARMYDVESGRFIGRDTLEYVNAANMYLAMMTTAATDPSGHYVGPRTPPSGPIDKKYCTTIRWLNGTCCTTGQILVFKARCKAKKKALYSATCYGPNRCGILENANTYSCKNMSCNDYLVDCIENPKQPRRNWRKFGKVKDCSACYRECVRDGSWPDYKCPRT